MLSQSLVPSWVLIYLGSWFKLQILFSRYRKQRNNFVQIWKNAQTGVFKLMFSTVIKSYVRLGCSCIEEVWVSETLTLIGKLWKTHPLEFFNWNHISYVTCGLDEFSSKTTCVTPQNSPNSHLENGFRILTFFGVAVEFLKQKWLLLWYGPWDYELQLKLFKKSGVFHY